MSEEYDENFYEESGREELVENDEISPEEEGFMKGYDDANESDLEDDEDEESI